MAGPPEPVGGARKAKSGRSLALAATCSTRREDEEVIAIVIVALIAGVAALAAAGVIGRVANFVATSCPGVTGADSPDDYDRAMQD